MSRQVFDPPEFKKAMDRLGVYARLKTVELAHIPKTKKRRPRQWDDAALAELKGLKKQGLKSKEIAAELTRVFNKKYTDGAVRSKLTRLKKCCMK